MSDMDRFDTDDFENIDDLISETKQQLNMGREDVENDAQPAEPQPQQEEFTPDFGNAFDDYGEYETPQQETRLHNENTPVGLDFTAAVQKQTQAVQKEAPEDIEININTKSNNYESINIDLTKYMNQEELRYRNYNINISLSSLNQVNHDSYNKLLEQK